MHPIERTNDTFRFADGSRREIRGCRQRLIDFCRYDAFSGYDRVGAAYSGIANVIQPELLTAMNGAMRARSPRKAWAPFLGSPLGELTAVSVDADLVLDADSDYAAARTALGRCYLRLASALWITDMAASKVLFLKRPKLVAISDSYVRTELRIEDPRWSDFDRRGAYYGARGLAVCDAVREVGRHNLPLLLRLKDELLDTPEGFEMSLSRIVDVLIWTEEASRSGHPFWSKLAAT